jgi:hypothetical protein
MDREPASFLPEHIKEVLKRKSSRDPSSRFPTKLHLLLSYSQEFPTLVDDIGLAWLTEEEFKMNKVTLAAVMAIKLNTLNVNLRDLHFQQLQRDKDGWTRWKRPGFTRTANSLDPDTEAPTSQVAPPRKHVVPGEAALIGRTPELPFQLGRIGQQQMNNFINGAQQLWTDLLYVSATSQVSIQTFVEKSAERLRYMEQPIDNAREVIRAIVTPRSPGGRFSFQEFCRFLAMFGPQRTVMLKIASLLQCSNSTGKWLTFDADPEIRAGGTYGSFDTRMPNCLMLHHGDRAITRVFNDPTVESGTRSYVIDDQGKGYGDWDEYFRMHPLRMGFMV